ncbi:MAG: hypothetical protein JWM53_1411 [bacterium]|nr:hypothetical protein [bacterium]
MRIPRSIVLFTALTGGCAGSTTKAPASAANAPSAATVRGIALPDAPAGGVGMDYLAYDRAHHRVWVPAGNTGKVDVVDASSGDVAHIDGFATREMERNGKKRIVGPSSATVGDGVVYVGNRGDSTVCAVDATSLQKAPASPSTRCRTASRTSSRPRRSG